VPTPPIFGLTSEQVRDVYRNYELRTEN